MSEKLNSVIGLYLDRLTAPELLREANLTQITKTLELLLEYYQPSDLPADGANVQEDALSKALRELAERMEHADLT